MQRGWYTIAFLPNIPSNVGIHLLCASREVCSARSCSVHALSVALGYCSVFHKEQITGSKLDVLLHLKRHGWKLLLLLHFPEMGCLFGGLGGGFSSRTGGVFRAVGIGGAEDAPHVDAV